MSLSLAEVIKKVGKQELAYVYDAPIHYVVVNKHDYTWTVDRIHTYMAILDQIEATEGPGVMVTVGTGKKFFSTGFDLPYWAEKVQNMEDSIALFTRLMARVLEFPMPTLCVWNGAAIAGGVIWGLCHDSRIMNAKVGTLCLSELKLGLALPLPYMLVCRAKLSPVVCAKWSYAITADQQEGIKDGVVDDTYGSPEDLAEKVKAFTKRYAAMGAMRDAIKTNKLNQYRSTIEGCRSFAWTPIQHQLNIKLHEMIKKNVAMIAKMTAAKKAKKAAKKAAEAKAAAEAKKPQPKL